MSVTLRSSRPDPHHIPPEEHAFSELIAGREEKYPTLVRALGNETQAHNPRVEWLTDKGVETNECQIVRFPYELEGAAEGAAMAEPCPDPNREEQLEKFLDGVERILVDGVPSDRRDSLRIPIRTCGGYKHYLGRELLDSDVLSLRVLRNPMWRVFTHTGYDREDGPVPMEKPIGEWLAEFSLAVY